ncbi:MAG: PadR family transcriptional regulator [Ectothiorhodospiraceae bacterium]|nr:PadR family transcriptional regulator [Ectothiorhodospiraceae bacterium]MCH8504860.1 PadR family transcriptional regulator [Ectothiorhodospiraceae bacterium]
MSIQHALLTSLLERPSTGYGLASRFDRSIGYFWQATHQQIYRELGRMARAGWVEAQTEKNRNGGGRPSKVYHVLPAGREELARWVAEPGGEADENRIFMVKVRAEAVVRSGVLGRELRRLVDEHSQRLAVYRRIEQRDFSAPDMSSAQQLQHAVLRCGIMAEETWLDWANQVAPLLEEPPGHEPD